MQLPNGMGTSAVAAESPQTAIVARCKHLTKGTSVCPGGQAPAVHTPLAGGDGCFRGSRLRHASLPQAQRMAIQLATK